MVSCPTRTKNLEWYQIKGSAVKSTPQKRRLADSDKKVVNKASKKARQESSTSGKLTFFACKICNLIQKLAPNPFSKDT